MTFFVSCASEGKISYKDMLGSFEEDDTSDQRLAVLNAIAKTQHMIAQKRAEAALPLAGDVQFVEDVHRGGGAGGRSGDSRSAAVAMAHVKENRSEFFGHWSKKIEAFVSDQSKTALELPPQLSANDRRELHALADKFNLSHVSEGDGMDRHLVLRKDVLHYKAPHLRPSDSQLDSLKQQQQSSRPKQALGNPQQRSVESRFELRRAKRKDDDEPMYADDAAEKAIRRLQKATDHYRNAVEIGMTMEELSQLEQRPIEAVLAEESKDSHTNQANPSSSQDVATQQWQRVMGGGGGPSPHAPEELVGDDGRTAVTTPEKVYDEQCLSCGTRTRLEYELAAWTCCGPCAVCRKETIFRLVEIKAEAEASRRRARSEDDEDDRRDTNGRRVDTMVDDIPEHGGAHAPSTREDIDVSAPEEPMTLTDTTDLLTMNDLPSGDVDTITRWARTFPGGDATLHKYLFLVIDWSDLLDAGCSSFGRRSRPDTLYLRCTAIQNADGTPSVHATAILTEAMERCMGTTGGGEQTAMSLVAAPDQCFRLALPSTSLYGAPLTVIARLDRMPEEGLDTALAQVKRKFGDAHFRYHRQLSALVSLT